MISEAHAPPRLTLKDIVLIEFKNITVSPASRPLLLIGGLLTVIAISNLLVDIDYFLGLSTADRPLPLQLIDINELRAISIAFAGGFISVLVFLPAVTSIIEAQKENMQLTVIERQHIGRLGDVNTVLVLAALGSTYSVVALLSIGYFSVAVQAALLVFLALQILYRLRKILLTPRHSVDGFLIEAVDGLVEDMEKIGQDREEIERRRDILDEHIEDVANRHKRLDIREALYIPRENRAIVSIPKGKRLKELRLNNVIRYLEDQFAEHEKDTENLKAYVIRIINPFKLQVLEGDIPILAVSTEKEISPETMQEIVNGASQQLQIDSTFQLLPDLDFWEAKDLVIKDFATCLTSSDLTRIGRNFQLFNLIAFAGSDQEKERRESLVNSLAGDISKELYLAGDQFMQYNGVRRIVLDECYSILRSAVKECRWFLLERFSNSLRALFQNELEHGFVRHRLPNRLLESEMAHYYLVLYEQAWSLRSKSDLPDDITPFYSRILFSNVRVAIDWGIESSYETWVKSSKKFLHDLFSLLERYFSGSDNEGIEVQAGALIVLSLQSYVIYRFERIEFSRAQFLFDQIFGRLPPPQFGKILRPQLDAGAIESLRWDDWPMESIRFGGGYSFSERDLLTKCAFLYWVHSKDPSWIKGFEDHSIKNVIDYFRGSQGALFESVIEVSLSGYLEELEKELDIRAHQEMAAMEAAEVGDDRKREAFSGVSTLFLSSKLITTVADMPVIDKRDSNARRIFSLAMPKSWFLDRQSPIDIGHDDFLLQRTERALFATLLKDCADSIHAVDEISAKDLEGSGRMMLLTNWPELGVDPLLEEAKKVAASVEQELEIISFRSRRIDLGIWVVCVRDVSLKVASSLPVGSEEIAQHFSAKLSFRGNRAMLEIFLNVWFEMREGASLWKIDHPLPKNGT